jgi:quercetin dioxygenase-like cupin family protein
MHPGQASWPQPIVRDAILEADYVQMAPGQPTPRAYFGDDHYWFIVWDGQVRVSINGVEPFVASKGFMVQVPRRVDYQLETVGDTPSLRFEVRIANAPLYYTEMSFTPPAAPGMIWYRGTQIASRTAQLESEAAVPTYTADFGGGRVYLDFMKEVVAGEGPGRAGAFVRDDRGFFNIIRGPGGVQSISNNLGHFHTYGHEFWFVPEGKISVQIEGVPELATGTPGDIITAVRGRFHRASSDGEMSTRIATNGYPEGLHVYQEPAPAAP